jgi:lipopolysaccharide biosynthesis glycosyltransferase
VTTRKITRIFVAGYRLDVAFTRCCVASIRKWYPDIGICLIKDELAGPYDTSDLENHYGVEIFDSGVRCYGWGMSKLEPLFLPGRQRVLILDSDVVFAGPVLARLEQSEHDFVVVDEAHPPEEIVQHYFDPQVVEQRERGFRFPGYVFNTGQIVATSGLLRRQDFLPFVSFAEPRKALQSEVFFCGEQGLLNFVLLSKAQSGELTIGRQAFMKWAGRLQPQDAEIARLEREPYDFMVHWAGPKTSGSAIPMKDLLNYFENAYYRGIGRGRILRPFHKLRRRWAALRRSA